MSFVKGATNTHAGDDVLAFERLLVRFESMIGDCNKELRNFNESSITLGKDNAGTKEKLAIYQTCQDVSTPAHASARASVAIRPCLADNRCCTILHIIEMCETLAGCPAEDGQGQGVVQGPE
jgi:hypothetical protein